MNKMLLDKDKQKRKPTEGVSKGRSAGRNIEKLSKQTEVRFGKLKP